MNKFHVGEEIILESKAHSQYNGEYTIVAVVPPESFYKDFVITEKSWGYDLGFVIPDGQTRIVTLWKESALRKKYKPSSESYSELLKSLKRGIIKV